MVKQEIARKSTISCRDRATKGYQKPDEFKTGGAIQTRGPARPQESVWKKRKKAQTSPGSRQREAKIEKQKRKGCPLSVEKKKAENHRR